MMTAEEQLEFYRTRFGRLVTRPQLELFGADLARSNLDVMSAALKQALATATSAGRPPRDVRLAVLGQYERIAASIAQLFPVFFVFESAWRSFVAAALLRIYESETWFHQVRDAVARGDATSTISAFGPRPASAELIRTLTHLLQATGGRCGTIATTYDLIEDASLGHLGKLIEGHWGDLVPGLGSETALGRPTLSAFSPRFTRVRRARNDAYHHRVVSDRSAVVAAAEQLLDLLDVHLGTRCDGMRGAAIPPLSFAVLPQARHG
jgi:hypothetical protein